MPPSQRLSPRRSARSWSWRSPDWRSLSFVITHLAGNLSLYKGDETTFNLYAQTLASWGWLLEVAEVGLVGLLVAHIALALVLKGSHRSARPVGYRMLQSKGGQSLSNRSSRNMIITGAVLLAFLVLHVWQFKFGPSESAGYVTEINGAQMRDLHRLVHETFQSPRC